VPFDFDLIELDGNDLRSPVEYRMRELGKLLRGPRPSFVTRVVRGRRRYQEGSAAKDCFRRIVNDALPGRSRLRCPTRGPPPVHYEGSNHRARSGPELLEFSFEWSQNVTRSVTPIKLPLFEIPPSA
jgi:hypothetical protein